MSRRKRRVCPLCGTPIRKEDAVRRGRHADCDTHEPIEHRAPSNGKRYTDNREAFVVTGRRDHEHLCGDCNTVHAGGCW